MRQLVLVRQRLIVPVHNSVHLLGQLVLLGNRLCVILDSLVVGLSYGNQVSPEHPSMDRHDTYPLRLVFLLFGMCEVFQSLLDQLVIMFGFVCQHLFLLLDGIAGTKETHSIVECG